jgi:CheY-like chemotaxis protein
MPSLPRIITVDPSGNVARIVRAAIELSDYLCRQIDVPTGEEALEEMKLTHSDLLIAALNLEDIRAFDLAEQARQIREDVAVLILADGDDPEMDMTRQREHGFVYLQRPLDIQQFSAVLFAGMGGEDIFAALNRPAPTATSDAARSPVPPIDVNRAGEIIDRLVSELLAMSVLLIDRKGEVLLERGPSANYIDQVALTQALMPSMGVVISMRDIVGGEASTLHFYDGDDRDVYTLSVGLHHMLCIVFDGEKGQREFGAVNRYGRRAMMDLIALLGAEAFFVQPVEATESTDEHVRLVRRTKRETTTNPTVPLEEQTLTLARAEGFEAQGKGNDLAKLEFEPIPDDAFDASFLDQMDTLDLSQAEQLFSLDSLGDAVSGLRSQSTIDEEQAIRLGILGKDLDNE